LFDISRDEDSRVFEPTTYTIHADSTALLVVDMQRDFVAVGAPYENPIGREAVTRINAVSAACRAHGIPVIFTTQMHRADGSDLGRVRDLHPLTADGLALREGSEGVALYDDLLVEPADRILRKHRFSAFYDTDLHSLLREQGVRLLLIAGVAANVCVESTVRDAFFRDYEIVLLADAIGPAALEDRGWGAFSEELVHRFVLTTVSTFFGEISTTSEVLRRIEEGPQNEPGFHRAAEGALPRHSPGRR
jgi:ureidoacrylate peracid hydrolase